MVKRTMHKELEAASILTGVNIAVAVIFFLLTSRQSIKKEAAPIEDICDFTAGDAFGIKKVLPIITTLIDLNKK